MKNRRIFCDAYGTYVVNSECKKCKIKRDCIKIKLPILNNKDLIKFI